MSYNFNDAADRLRALGRSPAKILYTEDAADLLHYVAKIVDAWHVWQDKTGWVQAEASSGALVGALGKHRADAMRDEIERLRRLVGERP